MPPPIPYDTSAFHAPGLNEDVAYLQKLLEALAAADPRAYYDASTALDEIAARLDTMAVLTKERTDRLMGRAGGDGRWQGEAAEVTDTAAGRLVRRMEEIAALVRPWAAQTDAAGESISITWRNVNEILTNP
ncbi:hypothetical protein [Streptomyces sp. NPDC056632]|uniref:hypothetical protein n=1 Tax=Streptomyces sp. NPDC056632 TaxID=3345884 RepID=UPI0036B7BE8C